VRKTVGRTLTETLAAVVLGAAFLGAGFFAAGFAFATAFAATRFTAGLFGATFFGAATLPRAAAEVRGTALATGFFAAIFLAVTVRPGAGFRADDRAVAATRVLAFAVWVFARWLFTARVVFTVLALLLAVAARAVFGFAARTASGFARATFTSPRMERPDGGAFPFDAFAGGRRVDLLRGVEAMGTTLGTVEA